MSLKTFGGFNEILVDICYHNSNGGANDCVCLVVEKSRKASMITLLSYHSYCLFLNQYNLG